jgi:hypothetical protein
MKVGVPIILAILAMSSITFGTALADPNYVHRPQGWFLLFPPLTKPDPVTGLSYIDDS